MIRRGRAFRWFAFLAIGIFASALARAQETLPPKPDHYFNDYAGLVDASVGSTINHELADFERATSNQLVVAIFPKLPSNSSTEDFTVRAGHAWGVGQKGRGNGAILFVFVAEHAVRIEVGYGLEPVLTDATCSQIIHQVITPAFHSGNYSQGLQDGVQAMMSAARGEYQGTGRTHAEVNQPSGFNYFSIGFFVIFMLVAGWVNRLRRGFISQNPRRLYNSGSTFGGGFIGGGGFGGGSGGGSSGGNDSFSGGGGDFGGGGAGGNW